jgi:hypothetical protein
MRLTRSRSIAVGIAAIIVAVVGLVVDARQTGVAFLVAYAAAVSVVLAMLALTMIAHLTTATWFGSSRRQAGAVTSALPALAVLGLAVPPLVQWLATPGAPGSARALYDSMPFFIARWLLYWIVWLAIAESLRAARRLEERGDVAAAARRFRKISCAGLIALGLTMTFASFDWLMALTPDWYSTVYGVYWFAGGAVGALALLALLGPAETDPVRPSEEARLQPIGKLMLTFVMFWVYIGFAQYIVIWSGNIPREVAWYVPRTRAGWGRVALVLLLAAGALPFVALTFRRTRGSRSLLAIVGALLLGFHYLDTYWLVVPALVPVTAWMIVVSAATLVIVLQATMLVAAARA